MWSKIKSFVSNTLADLRNFINNHPGKYALLTLILGLIATGATILFPPASPLLLGFAVSADTLLLSNGLALYIGIKLSNSKVEETKTEVQEQLQQSQSDQVSQAEKQDGHKTDELEGKKSRPSIQNMASLLLEERQDACQEVIRLKKIQQELTNQIEAQKIVIEQQKAEYSGLEEEIISVMRQQQAMATRIPSRAERRHRFHNDINSVENSTNFPIKPIEQNTEEVNSQPIYSFD